MDTIASVMQTLITRQRAQLKVTIDNLPFSGGASVSRSAKKLANELRSRQLAKEEGMRDLADALHDVGYEANNN